MPGAATPSATCCLQCGYLLRGLPAGSCCPECGLDTRRSKLGSKQLARFRLRQWLCTIALGCWLLGLASAATLLRGVNSSLYLTGVSGNFGLPDSYRIVVSMFAAGIGVWLLMTPRPRGYRTWLQTAGCWAVRVSPLLAWTIDAGIIPFWRDLVSGRPTFAASLVQLILVALAARRMYGITRRLGWRGLNWLLMAGVLASVYACVDPLLAHAPIQAGMRANPIFRLFTLPNRQMRMDIAWIPAATISCAACFTLFARLRTLLLRDGRRQCAGALCLPEHGRMLWQMCTLRPAVVVLGLLAVVLVPPATAYAEYKVLQSIPWLDDVHGWARLCVIPQFWLLWWVSYQPDDPSPRLSHRIAVLVTRVLLVAAWITYECNVFLTTQGPFSIPTEMSVAIWGSLRLLWLVALAGSSVPSPLRWFAIVPLVTWIMIEASRFVLGPLDHSAFLIPLRPDWPNIVIEGVLWLLVVRAVLRRTGGLERWPMLVWRSEEQQVIGDR